MRRLLCASLLFAALAFPQPVTVTVLATTDLHGNLLPIDYATNRPAARGLAQIATLVRRVRAENPNTVLIDCGDTIQGSPLETVYQSGPRTRPDPMMAAMNLLGYAAMTVGNHEYTAGPANLERSRRDANFPWLAANTTGFAPFVVKIVSGIRVAIVGVTTPATPTLEAGRLGQHRFLPVMDAVQATLAKLHTDLVILAVHSGLGRPPEDLDEHIVSALAQRFPQVDAIVFGHSHKELPAETIGKVLVIQPKNWGASLARLDFTFDGKRLRNKTGTLIPVTPDTPAAQDIVALARPYEAAAQRYLDTPVGSAPQDMTSEGIAVFINRVQLDASHAEVSLTAPLDPSLRIAKGPVTLRQITAIYPYENDLYVIEAPAQVLQGLTDVVSGAGSGSPDRMVRIALNSYRATQAPFRDFKPVWKSKVGIRELLIAAMK